MMICCTLDERCIDTLPYGKKHHVFDTFTDGIYNILVLWMQNNGLRENHALWPMAQWM